MFPRLISDKIAIDPSLQIQFQIEQKTRHNYDTFDDTINLIRQKCVTP
jgi:hypothetical protein